MIRNSLTQIITHIINRLIPDAKGDEWGNPVFTPIFKRYQILDPHQSDESDPYLEAVSGFQCMEVYVNIRTDKLSPIDPSLATIHFRQNSIVSKLDYDENTNTIIETVKSNPFKLHLTKRPALIVPYNEVVGNGMIVAAFNHARVEDYLLECIDASTPQAEIWSLTDINGNLISDTITTVTEFNPENEVNIVAGTINFAVGDQFRISVLGLIYRAKVKEFSDVSSLRSEVETLICFDIKQGYVMRRKIDPIFLPETIYN